jgi:hypothetical protein
LRLKNSVGIVTRRVRANGLFNGGTGGVECASFGPGRPRVEKARPSEGCPPATGIAPTRDAKASVFGG